MPPRATRTARSNAPTPAPIRQIPSKKAKQTLEKAEDDAQIDLDKDDGEDAAEEVAPPKGKGKGKAPAKAKGKGKAKAVAEPEPEPEAEEEAAAEEAPAPAPVDEADQGKSSSEGEGSSAMSKLKVSLTPEERLAKLKELRARMNQSTVANRKDLIAEHQKQKTSAQEIARLERQKKVAEKLREKITAEETGEDLDRKKNWKWSIEDSEKWDEKQRISKEKSNYEFDDTDSKEQRQYIKRLTEVKPDLHAYNLQKEAALGLPPGTLVPLNFKPHTETGLTAKQTTNAEQRAMLASSSKALSAAEALYRDANTLAYADNKPSEEAIDRVVGKINAETAKAQKASLKRNRNDDDGDVTYINDANKHFNKKINRYFDKYTTEIRANFERGTAL